MKMVQFRFTLVPFQVTLPKVSNYFASDQFFCTFFKWFLYFSIVIVVHIQQSIVESMVSNIALSFIKTTQINYTSHKQIKNQTNKHNKSVIKAQASVLVYAIS
jgi:hypothetical protein